MKMSNLPYADMDAAVGGQEICLYEICMAKWLSMEIGVLNTHINVYNALHCTVLPFKIWMHFVWTYHMHY